MVYILFILGFVFLIKGADFLVDGSSGIARRYHLPEMVIGLTIVSLGTSMPELVVNLIASFNGNSELAIGNVLGSSTSNVLLILGIAAIVKPLPIKRNTYFTEIPMSLVAVFMLGFLANANLFNDFIGLYLSRIDGIVMLLFFGLFMGYIYVISKERPDQLVQEEEVHEESKPIWKYLGLVTLGVLGLFLGGKWIVDGAIHIAKIFGLSETLIGLTLVAVGTSLPELVTSVVAAKKNKADMAVGNVMGSNIFNVLWILGLSATIRPLPFAVASNSDILMVIISSTLLIFAVINGKDRKISRFEGVLFVIIYAGYLYYLVKRG